MERLWAPWRLEYINKDRTEGCVFCEKPLENNDREAYIIYRGKNAYVILNIYPYSNGHIMVVPFAHVSSLEDLPADATHEMMDLAQLSIRALNLAFSPDGINMGINQGAAAGAGIAAHLHMHLVPRWQGDTNFMPVLGDTRIIPQSLQRSWEVLREALDNS